MSLPKGWSYADDNPPTGLPAGWEYAAEDPKPTGMRSSGARLKAAPAVEGLPAQSQLARDATNISGLFAQGALDQGIGGFVEGGLRATDTIYKNTLGSLRELGSQGFAPINRMRSPGPVAPPPARPLAPSPAPALAADQPYTVNDAAGKIGEFRQAVREVYPVDPAVKQSIFGQVVQGTGQAIGGLPAYLTGLGLPASAAQMFDQGYQDATKSGADLETAAAAGLANMPAAMLEQLGDKFQLGPMVKALRGNAQGGKQIVKSALNAFAGEAGTEALQQGHQNAIAQTLYDEDRQLTEGMGTAALVGGLTGATVAGGATTLGEGLAAGIKALDTRKNLAETTATLEAQQEQLLAGRRAAQMFPVDAQGNVTNELPLPEGMRRLETERGVFHYNPQQITADEIFSASAKGAENRALNLGSTSKPEAEAAAAQNNEPLVTITERTPDGTEVRSSVINQSAAARTQAEMQPGLTPGNTLAVETPEQTLAGRAPDFLADILNRDAQALAARQAADAKEKTAREQRQRDLDAKKENVGEAMQQGDAVLQDSAATFADVQGALKRVQFYAENNALGITQDQRIAAQRQQAKLAQRLAALEPAEMARRDLENQKRLADDAAALAAQKAQRTQAKQEFKQEVTAGRDATGAIDYTRLSDDDLATRAQAGDAKAEKILMQRADSAGDDRPTLLDVLARVKLPANDAALGGELRLLAEGMTVQQRRQLIATKEEGLDSVAEVLRADHGFSQIQTPADVIDFVERALRGEDIRPDRTGEGQVEFATSEPIVLWHAARGPAFKNFDMSKARDGAHFFATNPSHAAFFGNAKPYAVQIKNPKTISQTDLETRWDERVNDEGESGVLPRDMVKSFVEDAKAEGFDGLIIKDFADVDQVSDVYLPFSPKQITPATDEQLAGPPNKNAARPAPTTRPVRSREEIGTPRPASNSGPEFATRTTTAPADPAPRTDFRDAAEQRAYLRNPDNFNDQPYPGVVEGTPLWNANQALAQKSLELDTERRRLKLSFDEIETIAQRATGRSWPDFQDIADYDRTLAELRNPGSQVGKYPGGQTEIEFATIQDTFDLGGTPVGIDLPNAVRNLTPRWQEKTLAFESSLDKALYYAGGTNSETRDLVAARLAEQTGLTTGQIATLARQLRTRIEPLTRSAAQTGTIRVPAQMRSAVAQLTGAEFAQVKKPAPAPEPTDNATIEREWTALVRAFPRLAELFKLRIGSIQSEFDQVGYRGQVPSNVEAAVWGQKRLIVIAARAWRDRNNGTALLTHEVAHLFWDTLPTEAKDQLRALHARETGTKTGPLYTDQGFMRGSIQFERDRLPVARVAADPDLPVKEWFAERIAIINKAWAEGRLDRTETTVLSRAEKEIRAMMDRMSRTDKTLFERLAFELRQLWRQIVETFAIRSNIDPDSELFEAQFRAFILAGADVQIGRNAGASYAQKKAQFAQRPEFATGERPAVPAWPENFPNVVVMTTVPNLYAQGGYQAAKAGDAKAALDVVLTAARENKFFDLKKRFPDAILVPVRALERAGNNRLPGEFAAYFGHVTGLRVDAGIVQTNQTGHTGSGSDYRMAHRPSFDGAVIPGQTYIIVDDVVTMGGTLGELRAHIESRGGKVGAITTLAAAQFSAQIALTPKTKLALETKFDQVALREWLRQNDIYGGEFGALTEAEGRWLLAAKTLDAAGDRLAAQRRQGDAGGIAGAVGNPAPPAGPGVEFATPVNNYVAANDTPPDKIDAARTDIAQILGVVRDEQLELISYDGGGDLPRTNPDAAGSASDAAATLQRAAAALQRAAAALKAPNQPDAVRAAYGIDPRDPDYAGSERISSIIPALVADPKRSWDIRGAQITTARDVMTLVAVMRSPYVETAKVILLNRANVVVHSEIVGIGSVAAAIMDANQLGALLNRAPASKDGYNIIFSHNHPGGNPEPSKADNKLTRDLRAMLAKTKHTLVDHVITNGDTFYSYREQGLMDFGQQPVTTTKPRARGKDADTTVEPGATAPWEIVRRGKLLPATSYTVTRELLASLRQVDPTALHIVYLNIRNLVTALERVPNFQLPGDANTPAELKPLTSRIFSGLGREGAKTFIILAPDTMKAGTASRVMRHLKEFATDGNFYLLDYASRQLTEDSTAAAIGLLEPRPEQGGNALAEPGPDSREERLQQIRDELDALQNSQEDQSEINARGQTLTDERDRLQAEQRAEQREKQVESSITDVRHPAAVGTPEPGEAWMMVPRMTDAQLRQERMAVGQHLVDNYQDLGRAGRALLNARIDAIRAEEARRAPQPRRDAQGNALVDPIPKTSRRDALIAELQRGRNMAGEANRTGNDEALKEGTRLVRLAKERLDEEFPGWETAARPATAQAPSAAPDATDTQPGAPEPELTPDEIADLGDRNNAAPPPPPAPPIAEATQPDDAEPSPFTGENEPSEPIRKGKIAEVYGHSSYQPGVVVRTWRKVRDTFVGIRGPIPELPAFPGSALNAADRFIKEKGPQFYNGLREFYRALKSGNDYIQRTAEEQVARITRPLIEAGGKFSADDYAKLQTRQEQARRLRAEGKIVPPGALAEITALQSKMEGNPYVLFNRLVLMLDLKWRHQNLKDSRGNPIALPSSLNRTEVNAELARLGQTIQSGPHAALIRTALDRHMQLVKDVAADLQSRELIAAEQLANPYYFPHLTLEIKRGDKTEQRELTPTRVRPGTEADFRGYLQDPVGSRKPIETDYVRALYYHLVQVGAHNLKADAIAQHARPYDVMAEVRARAEQLSRTRGKSVSWEQAFNEEFEPAGYVRYGTDSRDAFPTIMVDRDKLARRLGRTLTSEDLQQQLARLGMDGVRLMPEDLKETLMAGNRETWIVPARVAEALRGIADRETRTSGEIEAAMKWALGKWKGWKLFMPWNHIRYEYGNVVADVEKIFSATPGTFMAMPEAAREIRAFWLGGEPSADLRAALKDGVINAITAQEMGGLVRLRAFKEFETTADKVRNAIKRRGSSALLQPLAAPLGLGDFSSPELSAFREAVFRYANFKHNLGRLRAGERPDYGGAYNRDIDAMQDSKPGAKDRAERQAGQISKATFGDYGDISVLGQSMRDKLIPFYSWMEVNFKYHANLFRNLRDMVRANEVGKIEAAGKGARAAATFAAGFGARAAGGFVLRLALPYVAVALWNGGLGAVAGAWDEDDEIEKELSEEDRRRFHIILGRNADGTVNIVYGQTALIDIMKWFSGASFMQQAGSYLNGKTDFPTALAEWRDKIVPDFLNNTVGSFGPYAKIPVTLATKKNPFPDVTDMRTVPAYDMRRVIIGQIADDFTANQIERTVSKDYYAARDFGTWAKQLVLQVRQRDPEAWAFYAIKDKAAEFVERQTGTKRESSYDAPDQQVLRNFRRAIYKGDVEKATQFYQRLLDYGYTADRFKQSIRAQEPLAGLPKENGLRAAFVAGLTPDERRLLARAQSYYTRINSQRGEERGLFPSERSGAAGLQRFQANPQVDRLRQTMENNRQLDEDARRLQAERALQNSLKNTR